MRKPFDCSHDKSTLCQRTIGPSHQVVARQCDNCGRIVGKWLKKEATPGWEKLPEWDHDIESVWQKSETEYRLEYARRAVAGDGVASFAKQDDAHGKLFWSAYSDYLASQDWLEKRHSVLIRARGICQGCGSAKATQVHHLTYARVGKEMLFDLVAVCDECHKVIHAS